MSEQPALQFYSLHQSSGNCTKDLTDIYKLDKEGIKFYSVLSYRQVGREPTAPESSTDVAEAKVLERH